MAITLQTIVTSVKAIVTGGVVKGQAATAQQVLMTQGTFINNGATPVVTADTNVTANSIVVVTLKTVGGTVGAIPAVVTITPGTGFNTQGTAADTSTYSYLIINI